MTGSIKAVRALIVGLAVATAVTGCRPDEYADPVNLNAGDAIATNKAVQTIDPWPRGAFEKHHMTNGRRIEKAYDTYQGEQAATEPAPKPQPR